MNIFSAIDTMLFSQGRVNKTKASARCVSRSWRWTGGTRTARVCELLWDRSPALRVHHMLCDTKVFPENPNETFRCTFTARAGLCVVKGNTRAKPGLETALLEGKVPFDLLFIYFSCGELSIGVFATFMPRLLDKIFTVFKYDCCQNYFITM